MSTPETLAPAHADPSNSAACAANALGAALAPLTCWPSSTPLSAVALPSRSVPGAAAAPPTRSSALAEAITPETVTPGT